jgi:GDP-L-fucose synthase
MNFMEKRARIFVAGHGGLAGSAIVGRLRAEGYDNLLLAGRGELDLLDQGAVRAFFAAERPEYVFLGAARVGGIHANNTYPAEFLYENLTIQGNVIHSAWLEGVRRLLFLGSSCIYPRLAPQPMKETDLLTGELEPTNEAYAVAKIAGLKMCEAYNRQYGTRFVAVMPTNLYGPGDNFHPENSHVLPALIRRFHEARLAGAPEVTVWGSGTPLREFLYIDEMADGCLFVMNLDEATLAEHLLRYPKPCFVNLGSGVEVSIRQLAETVREVVGYGGKLTFDASKPDGAPRKLLDVSAMKALGWEAKVSLRQGVEETYAWFRKNLDQVRG